MQIKMDKKIQEQIKEDIEKISKIKSLIQIKHIGEVPTHDGMGDKYLIQIVNDKSIGFTMATDVWSGDLVADKYIFEINIEDFDKINEKNINAYIRKDREKMNKEIIQKHKGEIKETTLDKNEKRLKKFIEEEIETIDNLNISFKKTTLEDVVVTLVTQMKGKKIHNKQKKLKNNKQKKTGIKNGK